MNYEEKASEILAWVFETLKQVENFAIEQAPIVIQEAYNWFYTENIFFICLGLLAAATGVILFYVGEKRDWYVDGLGDHHPGVLLWFIPLLGGLITFFIHLYELIYLLVAPRLYLINEISKLL